MNPRTWAGWPGLLVALACGPASPTTTKLAPTDAATSGAQNDTTTTSDASDGDGTKGRRMLSCPAGKYCTRDFSVACGPVKLVPSSLTLAKYETGTFDIVADCGLNRVLADRLDGPVKAFSMYYNSKDAALGPGPAHSYPQVTENDMQRNFSSGPLVVPGTVAKAIVTNNGAPAGATVRIKLTYGDCAGECPEPRLNVPLPDDKAEDVVHITAEVTVTSSG